MLTPSIPTRRSNRRPSTSLPADLKNKRKKDLRRGRDSILRNGPSKNIDRSSLFAAGWRQRSGQPEIFRNVFSERDAENDHSPAVESDGDSEQVRHSRQCCRRRT